MRRVFIFLLNSPSVTAAEYGVARWWLPGLFYFKTSSSRSNAPALERERDEGCYGINDVSQIGYDCRDRAVVSGSD